MKKLKIIITQTLKEIKDEDTWKNNQKDSIKYWVGVKVKKALEDAFACGQENVLKDSKK